MKTDFGTAVSSALPLKLDGCHGAVLMAAGVDANRTSLAAIEHPKLMESIHENYIRSGSNMLVTNTFSMMSQKNIAPAEFKAIIASSLKAATDAVELTKKEVYIGYDVGPTAEVIRTEEQKKAAFERFAAGIVACEEVGGFDYIIFETFGSVEELRLAYEAAEEFSGLPKLVSMTFDTSMHSWMGDTIEAYANLVNEVQPLMCGLNCSLTPEEMLPVVGRLRSLTAVPVFVQPNRGNPEKRDGKSFYAMSAEQYANGLNNIGMSGVRVVGGCCGADNECMKLVKPVGNPRLQK